MKVTRSLTAVPQSAGTVVTIGNFDGVHLGHQAILRQVIARSRELGLVPAVLTFDPHPAKVLAPARAPLLIQTTAQKLRRLESFGVEEVLLLPFSVDGGVCGTCTAADTERESGDDRRRLPLWASAVGRHCEAAGVGNATGVHGGGDRRY